MTRPTKSAIRHMYKSLARLTARLERERRQCDALARRHLVAELRYAEAKRRALRCKTKAEDTEGMIQRSGKLIADAEVSLGMTPGSLAPKSHNPPAWVRDKRVWARAKREARKGKPRNLYAVTATIYRNMGGRVR